MDMTWRYLLVGLGIIALVANGISYLQRTTSNVFSKWDYRRYLEGTVLLVVLLVGPAVTVLGIDTLAGVSVVAVSFLLVGLLGGEILKHFVYHSYIRPGAIGYHPFLVKYWPSWIIRDGMMVVDRAAIVRFGLVESEFDLGLSVFQNKGEKNVNMQNTDHGYKQAFIQNTDLMYPMQRHEEMAMTKSGIFLQSRPRFRIRCVAPDFMPSEQESPLCQIESLTESPIRFPLVPKSSGNKAILFRLIDETGIERGSIQVGCTVKTKSTLIGRFFYSWWWTVLAVLVGIAVSLSLLAEKIRVLFP